MILEVIKETKRYGHKNVSDTRSVGQRENSIPSHKRSLRFFFIKINTLTEGHIKVKHRLCQCNYNQINHHAYMSV